MRDSGTGTKKMFLRMRDRDLGKTVCLSKTGENNLSDILNFGPDATEYSLQYGVWFFYPCSAFNPRDMSSFTASFGFLPS